MKTTVTVTESSKVNYFENIFTYIATNSANYVSQLKETPAPPYYFVVYQQVVIFVDFDASVW